MTEDAEFTERAPSLDRDGRPAYRVASNDWDVGTAVVAAVCEVVGGDLLADEVLYDAVDPDALNGLFDGRQDEGRVVFELRGCLVEVRADGDHRVYGPDESGESASSTARSA